MNEDELTFDDPCYGTVDGRRYRLWVGVVCDQCTNRAKGLERFSGKLLRLCEGCSYDFWSASRPETRSTSQISWRDLITAKP